MSWTEQRFKQAVERGELRFFPRCARSYLYFKAKRGYSGNKEKERSYYKKLLEKYNLDKL